MVELENEIDCSVPARPWLSLARSISSSVSVPTLTELSPGSLGTLLLGPATLLHSFTGLSLEATP